MEAIKELPWRDYYETGLKALRQFLDEVNEYCRGYEAWQIIAATIITYGCLTWLTDFIFNSDLSMIARVKKSFFTTIKKIPFVRRYIEKEMEKVLEDVSAKKLYKLKPDMGYLNSLPKKRKSADEIMKSIEKYLSLDQVNWEAGNVSGTVYSGDGDLNAVVGDVYKKFTWSNPLHPDVFPSVRKMEAEIVRMTCNLFRGDPDESCGCVSSGGTESIMLASKAYRTWAYERGIKRPEMVCPVSCHAAFEKAAVCFAMRIVYVPVDPETRMVDLKAMKRAINKNTCMLVGSAPQFPHGVVDPIEGIAKLGRRYGIPVHVDACLGGFLIPFMADAGYPIKPFDFSVDGVTSISADTHKYGYAPKGTSILMYSAKKWLHHQYFVMPDWQGGIYATPMFAGSRSGAVVSTCWAAMMYHGRQGYVESTRRIVKTARHIEAQLRKIDGIFVYGKSEVSVVAFGSDDFDIYRLSSALVECGWNLNSLQFPSSIHICVTLPQTKQGVADRFVNDVRKAVAKIMKKPGAKTTGAGAMYGMAASIPDRSIVGDLTKAYMDAFYDTK